MASRLFRQFTWAFVVTSAFLPNFFFHIEIFADQKKYEPFRIMTYNVENFWSDLNVNSTYRYKEFRDKNSNWVHGGMTAIKAKKIAEVIGIADHPDVVGLQELESGPNGKRLLDFLLNHIHDFGYNWYALGIQEESNPVNVTTAVLSKWPIVNNQNIPFHMKCPNGTALFANDMNYIETFFTKLAGAHDDCERASRDPQVVDIHLGQSRLRVYNAHWKSKRGTAGVVKGMHKNISQLLREHIKQSLTDDPTLDAVVLGDFNSHYTDPIILEELGATGDVNSVIKGTENRLYNLWFDLVSEKRCSYSFSGRRSCFDNILLSSTLFDYVGIQPVHGKLQVVGWGDNEEERKLLAPDGTPFRWQYKSSPTGYYWHTGEGYSDHLPLVAHFVIVPPEDQSLNRLENYPLPPQTIKEKKYYPDKGWPCNSYMMLSSYQYIPKEKFDKKVCVELKLKNELVLTEIDQYQVGFQQGKESLVVTMTHSYGKNKRYLREVVQKSKGKKVARIKGRLGISQGFPAIFADKPEDIDILSF